MIRAPGLSLNRVVGAVIFIKIDRIKSTSKESLN